MSDSIELAIIGGGPAGLAAAEAALDAGVSATVFEAKPTLARKLLMAGKSGLNLTKHEPQDAFLANFPLQMQPIVQGFDARSWAEGLGEEMFIGSSGRVFPCAMKASPLLRKWLARLSELEVRTCWRWCGWADDDLCFETPDGIRHVRAKAAIFALGGGSWPRLGSDGAWVAKFVEDGHQTEPLKPANMGFDLDLSAFVTERFAGAAVKPVALEVQGCRVLGELTLTKTGFESGVVYSQAAVIREALGSGPVDILLDLAPDRPLADLVKRLSRPQGKASLSNHLRKSVGIEGVKAALLRETPLPSNPEALAAKIKALKLTVQAARPLDEAISTAGGVAWTSVTDGLMLKNRQGSFVAGEMLDWEAPTGGYLLTGCLASGFLAGRSAVDWLKRG